MPDQDLQRAEMNDTSTKKAGLFRRIRESLSRRLVSRVPDEMSCCEFECRQTQCLEGEWEHCRQRLEDIDRLREGRGQEPG
jgi:hypothetical protein